MEKEKEEIRIRIKKKGFISVIKESFSFMSLYVHLIHKKKPFSLSFIFICMYI